LIGVTTFLKCYHRFEVTVLERVLWKQEVEEVWCGGDVDIDRIEKAQVIGGRKASGAAMKTGDRRITIARENSIAEAKAGVGKPSSPVVSAPSLQAVCVIGVAGGETDERCRASTPHSTDL
jgi:hypothetical protein